MVVLKILIAESGWRRMVFLNPMITVTNTVMITVMRSLTISSRSARCDSWEGRSQLVLRHGGLRLCGRVPRNGGELDEHVHEGEPHRDPEKNDVRVTARGPVSLVKHTRLLVPLFDAVHVFLEVLLRLIQLLGLHAQLVLELESVRFQTLGELEDLRAQVLVKILVHLHLPRGLGTRGRARYPNRVG